MTTWVVVTEHPPQLCQTSNKVCADMFKGMKEALNSDAPVPGMKIVAGPLITSDHRSFMIAEADDYEVLRRFAVGSGAIQWNNVTTIPVITNDEALAELETVRPIFGRNAL